MPTFVCPDCSHPNFAPRANYCPYCGQSLVTESTLDTTETAEDSPLDPDQFVEEEFKAKALDEMDIGLTITDTYRQGEPIIYVNQAFLDMTGYSREEIVGSNTRRLRGPDTDPDAAQEIEEAIERGENTTTRILNYKKNGTPFWNLVRIRPLDPDLDDPRYFLDVQQDITEMERMNQKLEEMSRTDSLTGLDNKREFTRYLKEEWNRARRQDEPLGLVMFDLDRFKDYNDHYGHVAGDDVLEAVGETINESLKRPADRGARFGGEEFAVILPKTDEQGAYQLAEEIRERFQARKIEHEVSDVESVMTLSGGVASMVPDEKDQEERLIERADETLYSAKESGRNQVKCHSSL